LAVEHEGERQDHDETTDRPRRPDLSGVASIRRIRALLDEIRRVDAKAANLLLKEAVSG